MSFLICLRLRRVDQRSDGSARGCTAGEFCTGNATAGGGTYTSTFDVPLTEDEVRRGFTLNSAVTVDSHPSNATLATCTSVTQVGDCRDLFNVTVALFDAANTVVEKFERQVELDFSGLRTFDFTDTVQENSFSVLTGEFELFGVDAGFHSGFFGPKFSEPSITFTHDQIVEQQILDQIVQNDVIAAAPPVQINLPLLRLTYLHRQQRPLSLLPLPRRLRPSRPSSGDCAYSD